MGSSEEVVTAERGTSCLVTRGGQKSSSRCTFTGNKKAYYGFTVPSLGCRLGGGKNRILGPFCQGY